MSEYENLKKRLAAGWNTWNTRSVLSHVLLPEGLAINLCLKEYREGGYLKEALIGRQGKGDEQIRPGPHAYDGRYTELVVEWRGVEMMVQSAVDRDDLVFLVTPLAHQKKPAVLVVEIGMLWNRPGLLALDDGALVARLPHGTIRVHGTRPSVFDPHVATQGPYLAMPLDAPVGLSVGAPRSVAEIQALLAREKTALQAETARYGDLADVYAAIQTCMAWDTIYEPLKDRVISPVSRLWSSGSGGYILFCWDTYFAAYLASLEHKDLAYANAIEITREKTDAGFVPNFASARGMKSFDRSQPPVGSMVVRELYRRFGERWLLEDLFGDLLGWNRWWAGHRMNGDLLAWGSDPYDPVRGEHGEGDGVNDTFGGALESGLDNSPMYDGVPFDKERHIMKLQDVGLSGLYVMDCDALSDIARVLGRKAEAEELRRRADSVSRAMAALWDDPFGLFLNRRSDSGELSRRISPTNFYALLGRAATPEQANRMIADHFYNPAEFWGEWIMPSISRNDPAYPDQDYWRGRIWAPMNFLVYMGLRRYDLPKARRDLAEKSARLLLKEWRERKHVHENYDPDTGEGCNKWNSDRFYHWGGLLGLPALMEAGHLAGPEQPLP